MSQDHTLMASRFEFKYLIPQPVALRVRAFVQEHLELDEFGIGKPNLSYPVHSLYLDSDSLELYWRTVNGDKNRFKLRIRYYDEKPTSPVFFEIKARMKDVILKERAALKRSAVEPFLRGYLPRPEDFFKCNPDEIQSAQRFMELMLRTQSKPKMHIAYMREAYVSAYNNEFRVTFDREVRGQPRPDGKLITSMDSPYLVSGDIVILELKFTGRFPNWYRSLVQRFGFMQTGAAKYVESTTRHLGRGIHPKDLNINMTLD